MTVVELKDVGQELAVALAGAGAGEEVVIADAGRTVARVVPTPQPMPREFGYFKGQVRMADDFDAPLPPDELAEWEK